MVRRRGFRKFERGTLHLVYAQRRMLYGAPTTSVMVGEGSAWPLIPLGACVVALVVLGLTLPAPLEVLLTRIVEIVGR